MQWLVKDRTLWFGFRQGHEFLLVATTAFRPALQATEWLKRKDDTTWYRFTMSFERLAAPVFLSFQKKIPQNVWPLGIEPCMSDRPPCCVIIVLSALVPNGYRSVNLSFFPLY